MAQSIQPDTATPDLRSRKSRLIGELAAARSHLARDWQDVTHAAALPARIKSGLFGHPGVSAGTATALGLLASRVLQPFRRKKNRLPRIHPFLRLALLEAVNVFAKKEWHRTTARRLLDFFG